MTLTFDLLTLKVVSKSRVTWVTSVPILVFLGLSVLDLGPMYVTDSAGHNKILCAIALFAITINSNVCPHIRVLNTLMRESYA